MAERFPPRLSFKGLRPRGERRVGDEAGIQISPKYLGRGGGVASAIGMDRRVDADGCPILAVVTRARSMACLAIEHRRSRVFPQGTGGAALRRSSRTLVPGSLLASYPRPHSK